MANKSSAAAVRVVSIAFFGNIDNSLLAGSAAFARVVLTVVRTAVFGHL